MPSPGDDGVVDGHKKTVWILKRVQRYDLESAFLIEEAAQAVLGEAPAIRKRPVDAEIEGR